MNNSAECADNGSEDSEHLDDSSEQTLFRQDIKVSLASVILSLRYRFY